MFDVLLGHGTVPIFLEFVVLKLRSLDHGIKPYDRRYIFFKAHAHAHISAHTIMTVLYEFVFSI